MAPLTSLARVAGLFRPASEHVSTASLLSPFLRQVQQCRQASILSSLSDNSGAYSKRIRRGRGPSSGKGKTSGRGHKGQGQHGKVPFGFNGGQTKDEIVHGTHGFDNIFSREMAPLNLSRLQKWISNGRIDPRQPITVRELLRSGCITSAKDGVKLLCRYDPQNPLTTPVQLVVSRASASAIEAVEKSGGQVLTRFYSPSSLKRVLKGEVHPFYSVQSQPLPALSDAAKSAEAAMSESTDEVTQDLIEVKAKGVAAYKYRLADPTGRRDIEYYRDEAHRGYLSYLVKPGQGPSLYFKNPANMDRVARTKAASSGGGPKAENRIW